MITDKGCLLSCSEILFVIHLSLSFRLTRPAVSLAQSDLAKLVRQSWHPRRIIVWIFVCGPECILKLNCYTLMLWIHNMNTYLTVFDKPRPQKHAGTLQLLNKLESNTDHILYQWQHAGFSILFFLYWGNRIWIHLMWLCCHSSNFPFLLSSSLRQRLTRRCRQIVITGSNLNLLEYFWQKHKRVCSSVHFIWLKIPSGAQSSQCELLTSQSFPYFIVKERREWIWKSS